jgi:methylenetetrahydrofolate reductase (NADPH)
LSKLAKGALVEMGWWRARRRVVLSDSERNALRALVRSARYELIPLSSVRDRAGALPPGSTVTVTASPSHGIEATLTLAEWLVSRGHAAIPHLSAHMIRDRAHLTDLLARARAAGLREAFVVGGDTRQHTEFRDGLGLLDAMQEVGHPFDRIGIPAYPEGHADIPDDRLLRALKDKQLHAHSMTTQMSFNPAAVSAWIGRMRTEGVRLAVYLGVPGVTELSKLMTIAARIGVADSARYLKKNRQMVGHLMNPGSFGPDAFLEALAATIADPVAHVGGVHLFTFNHIEETAAWQQRMEERLRE